MSYESSAILFYGSHIKLSDPVEGQCLNDAAFELNTHSCELRSIGSCHSEEFNLFIVYRPSLKEVGLYDSNPFKSIKSLSLDLGNAAISIKEYSKALGVKKRTKPGWYLGVNYS